MVIKMSNKKFKEEHVPLIKILRTGTKKERLLEAKKQEKELKEHQK